MCTVRRLSVYTHTLLMKGGCCRNVLHLQSWSDPTWFPQADDLAVLLFVLKKVWTDIDPDIQLKAKERLSKWFDEDEIAEINDLFKSEE